MAYIVQADIEARLGTTLTTEQLAYFTDSLVPSIEEYINFETGTEFSNAATNDVYVDGTDTNMLVIPTMSNVTELYSVDSDDTETLIPATAYTKYPRGKSYILALRNLSGTWDEGIENYKVVGKLGYADVPADIKAVALEMAVSNLNTNLNSYKSERVGDWSVTYGDSSTSLSTGSLATLDHYKRLSRSI